MNYKQFLSKMAEDHKIKRAVFSVDTEGINWREKDWDSPEMVDDSLSFLTEKVYDGEIKAVFSSWSCLGGPITERLKDPTWLDVLNFHEKALALTGDYHVYLEDVNIDKQKGELSLVTGS